MGGLDVTLKQILHIWVLVKSETVKPANRMLKQATNLHICNYICQILPESYINFSRTSGKFDVVSR